MGHSSRPNWVGLTQENLTIVFINRKKKSSVIFDVIGSVIQNDCYPENKEIQEAGTYAK